MIKILYVDDEPINLQLLEINLSEYYDVLTAEDGFQGLQVLEDNPDILVVISDMKMPNMNGLEFIRKAKVKFAHKKYYILTGFEITVAIQSALDNRLIIKYFKKPFDINEIKSSINEVL